MSGVSRWLRTGGLMTGVIFFFASSVAAQGVRLGRWGGSLDASADYSRVRSETGDSETLSEITHTEERLTIRNTGAFIFDPRLMTLTFGGTFGLSQEWSMSEANSVSIDDTRNGTLWGYDTFASILPGRAISLNLFANRNQFSLTRELAGSTDITTENRGATLFVRRLVLPSTVTFRQEFNDEESRTGSIVTGRDESRNIVTYEGRRGWMDSEIVLRYDFTDKSDEILPELDFQEHDGDLVYSLDFGTELNYRLDSRLRATSRTGISEETRFEVEELLRIDHTEQLRTQYRYFFEHTTRPDGNVTRQTGSVSLNHQLYESLNTDLQLDARLEDVPEGGRNVFGGRLSFDYTKRLPGDGRLFVGLQGVLAYEDEQFEAAETFVFDERHTFATPFALSVALDNPFVVTSSVKVTKVVNGPSVPGCGTFSLPRPLEEGVDYTLRTVGDITEIVPIPCSLTTPGINADDTIEVDYRFAVSPSLEFITLAWRVDMSVDYGWIRPFFRHEKSNQTLISGRDGRFLDDRQRDIIGVELRYDGERLHASFEGEVERFTARDQSYDTLRMNQFLRYTLAPGLRLTLRGQQVFRNVSRPEDRQTQILTGMATLTYVPNANFLVELLGSVREFHDTLVIDERITEAGLKVDWLFGKLRLSSSLRAIERQRGATRTKDFRAYLRLVRRF